MLLVGTYRHALENPPFSSVLKTGGGGWARRQPSTSTTPSCIEPELVPFFSSAFPFPFLGRVDEMKKVNVAKWNCRDLGMARIFRSRFI